MPCSPFPGLLNGRSFSTQYQQIGTAQYDTAFDAIRITAKAGVTDAFYEALFIGGTATGSLADIIIAWETTRVSFTICANPVERTHYQH